MRAHSILSTLTLVAFALAPMVVASAAAADRHQAGIRPAGPDGRPLNLDFETGTLDDWTAQGAAFALQPVEGDTVHARRSDMRSDHTGKYWIGTFERDGDMPRGTLTSAPFEVTHPYASFLIGGGGLATTCVELVDQKNREVVFRVSAANSENLRPVVTDLREFQGHSIFIRLVDNSSRGWGHINFDDFRLYDSRPSFDNEIISSVFDRYQHSGLEGEEAARVMTVPEGFQVTLSAAEPDVHQPIAMTIDDRGRLWVAEAYSYPIRVDDSEARDRILIFEDVDGDGRFDNRTVFYDKLNLVSGLEVGYGGVWVGAAPYLLFIPDADGDDVPDGPPQVLLDGWGYEDTHETLNAFIWGPDGWLYGCHGVFTHSLVGKPGTPDADRVPINAGIWRYHPTRHEFEVFAHGTSNPWGVDFDDYGQALLTACVIPHLFHVIQHGRYHRQAGEHFNPYTYDDIKTCADHVHWVGVTPHSGNGRSDEAGGGHAHSGAMIYLGGGWPERYRGQIFMNNIHGARINMDVLERHGSGFVGRHGDDFLLANDVWSQIINLRYGPDGQVYMIDWYDENQCHRPDRNAHDATNGRIFKVTYGEPRPVVVDLKKLSDRQLVDLQLDENDWYVRHARRILHERGANPEVHRALAAIAFDHPDATRRLRALWCLHVTGGLSDELAMRGLEDANPFVRGWCIQLMMEDRDPPPGAVAAFARLAIEDPSPVVRLYLASALERLPLESRWDILEGLVAHEEDADDHNLPLMYWYAAEPLAEPYMDRAIELTNGGRLPQLLSFTVRRVAAVGSNEAIATLVRWMGRTDDAATQAIFLEGVNTALAGRRQFPMPDGWSDVYGKLAASNDAQVRQRADRLAVTFGEPSAIERMRARLTDRDAETAMRRDALDALLGIKDPQIAPVLLKLLAEPPLRAAALRALAAYDVEQAPGAILDVYATLSQAEKRDALATLASRPAYGVALMTALADGRVTTTDVTADVVRQLRNLNDERINQQITETWGSVRETAEDKAKLIDRYKKLLASQPVHAPDPARGRAAFAKICQQCHKLFGTGGEVGPELTGSNRADLDYLLSNVLDPSALMAREYMPSVIATTDGRIITGIVRRQDDQSLTVQTANELITLPRDEIDEMLASQKSMMPDDLLKPLDDDDVRALVAYLASPRQVPLLATADNAHTLFNGQDLNGWQGDPQLWTVEDGHIVGRTSGLDHNEFLASDLLVDDFRLTLEVQLVDNEGNSGIQFRSERLADGEVKGYQADVGRGWWGKLYEERGRGLLWSRSGEAHVRSGAWNRYEIVAVGDRIRTYINDQLCVDLEDPDGSRRGIMALQLHSGPAMEVRFRNLQLELDPQLELAERDAQRAADGGQ